MKIINKENYNQIKAEEGYMINWNGVSAKTINVPLSRDIQEVFNECEEVEFVEVVIEEDATEEDYLAALEKLGVSE